MSNKEFLDAYKEAMKEWLENYKSTLKEWKERFKIWKRQLKEDVSKGSIPPFPPLPEIPRMSPLPLHGARSNVVASRIRDEELKLIDMLIEAGLFETRSEAVAFLVKEGIKARQDIIEKVSSTLEEIRKIRRQAEEQVKKLKQELGMLQTEEETTRICPQCRKDLSDLPSDIKVCPYCGMRFSRD